MGGGPPEPPLVGSCYGFAVRSHVGLGYLRAAGPGDDPLVVGGPAALRPGPGAEPRYAWPATPPAGLGAEVLTDGERLLFRVTGGGWYGVEPAAGRIIVPPGRDEVEREERLWAVPAMLSFLARGDLPLHAAAIDLGGRAILLAAPTTAGKTTLAAAFARAGHRVLAEDLTCLRPAPIPAVVPGPAMLRLRPDMAEAVLLPDAEVRGRDGGRLHLALGGPRGDCRPVPLAAVVLLHTDPGGVRLAPIPPPEAIRAMWSLSFALPTPEGRARAFAGLADLAGAVPAYDLHRPKTLDALDATVAAVVAGVPE